MPIASTPVVVPPSGFVTGTVQFAMMATAPQHGEFVTDLGRDLAAAEKRKVATTQHGFRLRQRFKRQRCTEVVFRINH
jgi:hypothetical protein